jgi:hypothetical protein
MTTTNADIVGLQQLACAQSFLFCAHIIPTLCSASLAGMIIYEINEQFIIADIF